MRPKLAQQTALLCYLSFIQNWDLGAPSALAKSRLAARMNIPQAPKKHIDGGGNREDTKKPYFRPVKDDTKPLLQDPILRSDPIETEEAVLLLPPLPDCLKPKFRSE